MKKDSHPSKAPVEKDKEKISKQRKSEKHTLNVLQKSFETYKYIINILKTRSKHASCPHPHSCAHYILTVRIIDKQLRDNILCIFFYISLFFHLKGSTRAFSYGLYGQIGLNLIFRFKKLLRNPKLIKETIFQKENLKLAVFLGGSSGLYRVHKLALYILEKCTRVEQLISNNIANNDTS